MGATQQPFAKPARDKLRDALAAAFASRYRFAGGRFVLRRGPGDRGERPRKMGRPAWREIVRQIGILHEAYTGGAEAFRQQENPIHSLQAGYQFYFLPRNLFRVRRVLDQLRSPGGAGKQGVPAWPAGAPGEPFSVLDLGCGTGAFTLAVLSRLAEGGGLRENPARLRLVLVDQGRELLDLAQANIRGYVESALPGISLSLEVHADGVERFLSAGRGAAEFSVAGSAMMVNEFDLLGPRRATGRAARFAVPLRRRVREGGLIILVEPGTRKGYMHLMAVREIIGGLPILYPCPHLQPCPLWDSRVSRWCHATFPLPRPFFFDRPLREEGGLRFSMRELNLCGLALRAGVDATEKGAPPGRLRGDSPGTGRVVSGLLPAGGGRGRQPPEGLDAGPVVLLCTPEGKLREIPAAGLGRNPRGSWAEAEPAAAAKKRPEGRWKNGR
ncbi:MAG: small ribosomal subunit Rsm22 family protein [bacterium]